MFTLKKNILVLATGGTIAGTASESTDTIAYDAAVLTVDALLGQVPELQQVACVRGEQLVQVDSVDMTPAIWLQLGQRLNHLLAQDQVDGVVVTHGTDTMEETAFFLNLTIKSHKPVVMVGAMRPASAMSTDGPMNLYNGVSLAASPEAAGKGVLVALNDTINSGREVTKTNTALQDTFKSPELGYLGYMQNGRPHFYRLSSRRHTRDSEFDIMALTQLPAVEIVYGYADCHPALALAAVEHGAGGLIWAGMGNGGMPAAMARILTQLQRQGTVIVRSTRVGSGIIARNGAVNDDQCGFVVADTLNPQKARILLMLALTQTADPSRIQQMFWTY